MAKQKYYAVQAGRTPGIYYDWDACKAQVDGFPGAKYKSFPSEAEAQAFAFPDKAAAATPGAEKPAEKKTADINLPQPDENTLVAYVDGSFYDGKYAFGCVFYEKDRQPVTQYGGGSNPELLAHRNVTGEMLGSIHAAKTAIANGYKKLAIIYDYAGIEQWAKGSWKANTPATRSYRQQIQELMQEVDIQFVKVKGHTGCEGNELADKAAKEGLKSNSIPYPLNLETGRPYKENFQKTLQESKLPSSVKKLFSDVESMLQNPSADDYQMD